MVAANFACSCPTNRVLRNVALDSFGFIGIEARGKPAVITAWTAPFDVVGLTPDWSPQIDHVAQPFEHCRFAYAIIASYHAICRGTVTVAALWKEKSALGDQAADEG
jgi:hypothetical protein